MENLRELINSMGHLLTFAIMEFESYENGDEEAGEAIVGTMIAITAVANKAVDKIENNEC